MLVSTTRTSDPSAPAVGQPPPWRWSESAGAACVTVSGELDLVTVCLLDRELRDAQADGSMVVLDARDLEHVDSIGLELILVAARRAAGVGARFVVRCGPDLAWYLELIGLDRALEVDQQLTPTFSQ